MTIKRENRSNCPFCRGSEVLKKWSKHSKVLGVYLGYMGAKSPGRIEPKFFGRRYPRRNNVFQIWWRSAQGFSVGWGSNFAIPHWLWRSSLQLSHTTVWACDVLCQTLFYAIPSSFRWWTLVLWINVWLIPRPHSQTPIFCIVSRVDKRYI